MYHIEISALFHLKAEIEDPVTSAQIGSGVSIELIDPQWLYYVKSQCPKVAAREQIEWNTPYTHRLFYRMKIEEDVANEDLATDQEKELIRKAIVLSRLVKPTSVGYDSVWVKSLYRADGRIAHYHDNQVINNLNVAFVIPNMEDWNSITMADAQLMAELWDSFLFLFDNEKDYRRVVRAIKTYEIGCSIYFAEMGHTIMHAALESLICTHHLHNKSQVTQRLPQLVSFITFKQAEDIYKL